MMENIMELVDSGVLGKKEIKKLRDEVELMGKVLYKNYSEILKEIVDYNKEQIEFNEMVERLGIERVEGIELRGYSRV